MEPEKLQIFMKEYPFREIPNDKGEFGTTVVTCPVRLAFAFLDDGRERSNNAGEKWREWSASLIIPPGADLTVLATMAARKGSQAFGVAAETLMQGPQAWEDHGLVCPLKRQSKPAKKYDGFTDAPNAFYLDCGSRFAVPVFSQKPGPDGKLFKLNTAKDAGVVYSGMWALAILEAYSYPSGKPAPGVAKGVKFGLRQLQKIYDDEEFKSAGGEPSDAFGAVKHLNEAATGGAASAPAAGGFAGGNAAAAPNPGAAFGFGA